MTSSVLQEDVCRHEGASVSAGCAIAAGVVVGKGFVVKPNSRIALAPQPAIQDDDYDSDDSNKTTRSSLRI